MRLLLAEDDEVLGRAVARFFLRQACPVDWVREGSRLLELRRSSEGEHDCLLLDLGLPDLPGQDALINLRIGGVEMPIVVISARGGCDDRIRLLELGADDYLVKPFDLGELDARVRAVVRRGRPVGSAAEAATRFGRWRLLRQAKCVLLGDQRIALTATEFKVLDLLVERAGRVVPRQQLQSLCTTGGSGTNTASIEVHVFNLRRKLGVEVIETVRGVGYALRAAGSGLPGRPSASTPSGWADLHLVAG